MRSRLRILLPALAALVVVAVAVVAWQSDGSDDDPTSPASTEPGGQAGTADGSVDLAVVGDSFAEQSRDALIDLAEERGMTVSVDAFGGSSLCAWMGRIGELREQPPARLVLSFAGNIFQHCINPTCDPEGPLETCQAPEATVNAERYRNHLDLVLDLFSTADTEVYVVAPPPIADATLGPYAAAMREMYRVASEERDDVRLIDSSTALDPDGTGEFQVTLPCAEWDDCPASGQVQVREDDGIHLTPAGGQRFAHTVLDALD